MSAGPPPERLTCGRSTSTLLAQVAHGHGERRDEHQRGCPHCRAALAEYTRLWAAVHELGAERITPPEGFVDAALEVIRGSVEHTTHGVLPSPAGVTRVSARAVMIVARGAAEGVDGVRVALGRPVADVGLAGRSTAIEITLAAGYGWDLRRLGDRVRDRVAAAVRELTGLDPVHVDVIIDDVFEQLVVRITPGRP